MFQSGVGGFYATASGCDRKPASPCLQELYTQKQLCYSGWKASLLVLIGLYSSFFLLCDHSKCRSVSQHVTVIFL